MKSRQGARAGCDDMAVYASHAIENVDSIALTPGGLLLIAIMACGDYGNGVPGCGISIAHGLEKCGFGDSLLAAAEKSPENHFQPSLDTWRDALCSELSTNQHGFLNSCHMALTSKITGDFPDLGILQLYLRPTTSWSQGSSSQVTAMAQSWKPREPTICQCKIAAFCSQHLGWTEKATVLTKFKKNLWDGVLWRMLCSPVPLFDKTRQLLATPNTQAHVLKIFPGSRVVESDSASTLEYSRLRVSVDDFVKLTGRTDITEDDGAQEINVWEANASSCRTVGDKENEETPHNRLH